MEYLCDYKKGIEVHVKLQACSLFSKHASL